MTPAALRALAARVETEEPSEELRAAVLTAFGSEAEWLTAPNPLVFVDDAKSFQPEGWQVLHISDDPDKKCWYCELYCELYFDEGLRPHSKSATLARAWTAASLRALASEKEHADG